MATVERLQNWTYSPNKRRPQHVCPSERGSVAQPTSTSAALNPDAPSLNLLDGKETTCTREPPRHLSRFAVGARPGAENARPERSHAGARRRRHRARSTARHRIRIFRLRLTSERTPPAPSWAAPPSSHQTAPTSPPPTAPKTARRRTDPTPKVRHHFRRQRPCHRLRTLSAIWS
jgi:hypothetical protein